MKKLELKQIIKEEIKNVLKQFLIKETRTIELYKKHGQSMKKKIITPGIYNITDPDVNGYRNDYDFHIKVIKKMSLWDIALELAEKINYISPWGSITINKSNGKPRVTVGTGVQTNMFDSEK